MQFHLVEGLVHIRMFTQRSCHSAGQADHGDTASTLHLWLLDTFAGCIPVVTFCLLVLSCICQLCMLDSVVRMRLWFYRLFVGLVLNLTTLCLGQCCYDVFMDLPSVCWPCLTSHNTGCWTVLLRCVHRFTFYLVAVLHFKALYVGLCCRMCLVVLPSVCWSCVASDSFGCWTVLL